MAPKKLVNKPLVRKVKRVKATIASIAKPVHPTHNPFILLGQNDKTLSIVAAQATGTRNLASKHIPRKPVTLLLFLGYLPVLPQNSLQYTGRTILRHNMTGVILFDTKHLVTIPLNQVQKRCLAFVHEPILSRNRVSNQKPNLLSELKLVITLVVLSKEMITLFVRNPTLENKTVSVNATIKRPPVIPNPHAFHLCTI